MRSHLGFDPCVRPHHREMADLAAVVLVIDDDAAAVRDALGWRSVPRKTTADPA